MLSPTLFPDLSGHTLLLWQLTWGIVFIYASSRRALAYCSYGPEFNFQGCHTCSVQGCHTCSVLMSSGSSAITSCPSLRREVRPADADERLWPSLHTSSTVSSRQEKHLGEGVKEAGLALSSILSLLPEHERMLLALL